MEPEEELKVVQQALDEAKKSFPATPSVDHYEVELYVDSSGEDAAFITVILKDNERFTTYDWPEVAPIRAAIVDQFRKSHIGRWPYVEFSLKSELEDPEEEDKDEDAYGVNVTAMA